jgi:hypothetical protein
MKSKRKRILIDRTVTVQDIIDILSSLSDEEKQYDFYCSEQEPYYGGIRTSSVSGIEIELISDWKQ